MRGYFHHFSDILKQEPEEDHNQRMLPLRDIVRLPADDMTPGKV
jgi:hypothetical protein